MRTSKLRDRRAAKISCNKVPTDVAQQFLQIILVTTVTFYLVHAVRCSSPNTPLHKMLKFNQLISQLFNLKPKRVSEVQPTNKPIQTAILNQT